MNKYFILLTLSIVSLPCVGMAEPTVANQVGIFSAGKVVVDTKQLEEALKKTAEDAAREGFERGVEEGAHQASTASTSDSLFSPIKKVFSFIPWQYLLSGTGLAVLGGVVYWRIYGATPQQLRAARARVDADSDARLGAVRDDMGARAAILAGATEEVTEGVAAADGHVRGVAALLRDQQEEESAALQVAKGSLEDVRLQLLARLGSVCSANPLRPSAVGLTLAQTQDPRWTQASLMDTLQGLDATSLQNVAAFVELKDQFDGLAAAAAADDRGHQQALAGLQQRLRALGEQFGQADQAAADLHSSLDDTQDRVDRIRRGVTGRGAGAGRPDLSLLARALLPPDDR